MPEAGSPELVAAMAVRSCQRETRRRAYHYQQNGVLPSSLWAPAPIYFDCAAFSRLCLKAAHVPDPMGNDYGQYANSGELFVHGHSTGAAQVGSLVFYGPDGGNHVNVHIGNGICANMGSEGEPKLEGIAGPVPYAGPVAGFRLYGKGIPDTPVPFIPGHTIPPDHQYDWAKVWKNAWYWWGTHGARAKRNSTLTRQLVERTNYCDTSGART